MAKGDFIEVNIRGSEPVNVLAAQNGRTVDQEVESDGGVKWLVVRERTRGGTVLQTLRVQIADVVSIHQKERE